MRDMGLIPRSGRSCGGGNGNHSSIFAWKIPWTEEHGRLQPTGLQSLTRLSNWAHMHMRASVHTHTHTHTHTQSQKDRGRIYNCQLFKVNSLRKSLEAYCQVLARTNSKFFSQPWAFADRISKGSWVVPGMCPQAPSIHARVDGVS